MRAAAVVESWWDMDVRGDNGIHSASIRCAGPTTAGGKCQRSPDTSPPSTPTTYGAIIRSYYDGKQTWLNTVSGNGKEYRAGDLEGNSMGAWYSGRWWGRRNARSTIPREDRPAEGRPDLAPRGLHRHRQPLGLPEMNLPPAAGSGIPRSFALAALAAKLNHGLPHHGVVRAQGRR